LPEKEKRIRDNLCTEHLERYLGISESALKKVKIKVPEGSHLFKVAEDFFSMAKAYFSDANFFFENGDYINAFACVNYAHGWLDAGARLGLFDVGGDHNLFTLLE